MLATVAAFCFLPARAESRLIFPRLLFQAGRLTGIAIANPSTTAAQVTFTVYNSDGSPYSGPGIINPQTATIPAGQQYARVATQIFAAPQGASPVRLWMDVTSPTDGLAGFFLDLDNSVNYMDGADLVGTGSNLILPLVENAAGSSTDISVINPGSTPVSVSIDFVRANGTVVSNRTATIPARGAHQGPLSTLYPISYSEVVALRVRSDRPVICYGYIFRQSDNSLVTLAAQNASLPAKTLNFPQLAEGDGWSTTIGLTNLDTSSQPQVLVTITAYKADGTLFTAPTVRENPVTRQIPLGAVFRSDLRSLFGFAASPLQVGWIKAEAPSASINGYVEYGAGGNRALVAAQLEPFTKAIFSHQAQSAPYFTGLAILNPGSLATNIEIVSMRIDGSIIGRTQRVLGPGRREAKLIQEYIPAADGASGGSVYIRSSQSIVATQLFGTSFALANVPPQQIIGTFDPTAALPKVGVSPPLAVVETLKKQKFSPQGFGTLTWMVNDIPGGNNTVGTVSPTGEYSAPSKAPVPHNVTIRAVDATGTQSAGSAVNVVQRETLTAGLTLVTSVAYFSNLQRFFVAEQQILTGLVAAESPPRATTNNAKISEHGVTTPFLTIQNETIGKMLPFTDSTGASYLLVAGTDSGRILKIKLSDKSITTVASGLNRPSSLAIDAISKNLLVAELGANQITVIPNKQYDSTGSVSQVRKLLGLREPKASNKRVTVPSPQGVAVDECSGTRYVTLSDGRLLQYVGNKVNEIVPVGIFDRPTEMLPLYLEGFEDCEEALILLVCDFTSISLVDVSNRDVYEFINDLNRPQDLEFFKQGNNVIENGEAAVTFGEDGRVSEVRIGGLYDEEEPEPFDFDFELPYRDPDDDTFETAGSVGLSVPDALAVEAFEIEGFLVLGVVFAAPVTDLDDGLPSGLGGFIDFDYKAGGKTSHVDAYDPFGITLLEVDAYIDLYKSVIVNTATGIETPIFVFYLEEILLVLIPPDVLADFPLRLSATAMIFGNQVDATDSVPNALFVIIDTAGVLAASANAAANTTGVERLTGVGQKGIRPAAPKVSREEVIRGIK